ncbi:hypothetical protein [Hyphobacterium marinum]|uniref:Peptidase M61 catalytic domain-containing protein n=1 Tax=Hyphobacterium marinum TaxID=3116574 RepID=A0ABU7LZD0_9PROT|nr:hypothetical protein [Hyphobacterium sp. Y6023]MEE2566885.1 hypothetical protein [Hyphobacterium sp. Y6023]
MRIESWFAGGAAALLLMSCGAPAAVVDDAASADGLMLDGTGVTAVVTALDDGRFEVAYRFAEPQTGYFFSRSGGDYRTAHWASLDDGVTLERVGGFDTLLFDGPRTEARFVVEPWFGQITGDYSPYVQFSDGAVALFTGQFEILPVADRDAVLALDGDIRAWSGEQPVLGVRIVSPDRMVMNGEVLTGHADDISQGDGAFVYIGDGEIETGESFVGVLDGALPAWIRERFDSDLATIFGALETGWGFELPQRASVFFAFEGYDNPGFSNKGGATRSLLMLQSSGQALREPSPQVLAYLQWFFAHEGVHLFQNAAGLYASTSDHAWITEGGANTMANAVLATLDGLPEGRRLAEYRRSYAGCLRSLAAGPLTEAVRRGDHEASYLCGDLIGLMSWAATPDADIYIIGEAVGGRTTDQPGTTGEMYFATLIELGADPAVVDQLRALVGSRLADPESALRAAMVASGLNPVFDEAGQLSELEFPQ